MFRALGVLGLRGLGEFAGFKEFSMYGNVGFRKIQFSV